MGWFGHHKLGIMVTCAEWPLHQPRVDLYKRVCKMLHVDGVDVTAVPGPDGLLNPDRSHEWQATVGWVKLLIHAHKPVNIAVVAHQKCAAHQVDNDQHEHDVLEAALQLKEQTAFDGQVLAIVATHNSDKNWGLKEIGVY